jgi:hypothetical protein
MRVTANRCSHKSKDQQAAGVKTAPPS